jgi:branched-subunit amino acid aminotransferase/4-amino-4-deoxychorismate lyase
MTTLLDDLRTLAMVNYGHFTSMRVDRGRVREAVAGAEGPVYAKVNVFARGFDASVAEQAPDLLVTVRPLPPHPAPARVCTVEYERDLPPVKHVGTFGLFHQYRLARRRGYDDAIFVDRHGEISESTVCFADGGTLVWPSAPALPGVAANRASKGYGTQTSHRNVPKARYQPKATNTVNSGEAER